MKQAGKIAAIGVAGLLGVTAVGLVGGRLYLNTDGGRERILQLIDGREIGRFGTINIQGLRGDLLKDFTAKRLTISDEDGVWLEAHDIRMDWSYLSLISRRFQANDLSARTIKVLRRPTFGPKEDEEDGKQPIDVVIGKFSTELELMEDFSKEYGHWRIAGDASMPRSGSKSANIDAASLSRPGDFLKLAANFSDKPEELRVNLRAEEARGGPIAGMLGYSPDRPFSAKAVVDGQTVDVVMRTGQFVPLNAQGRFSDQGSRVSGYVDFSGSDLFAPFVERIGRTARIGLATIPDAKREGYQTMGWRLIADNIQSSASGYVRSQGGLLAENVTVEVSSPSLSRLAGAEVADALRYQGVFNGDSKNFELKGRVEAANVHLSDYRMARLAGPLNLGAGKGDYNLTGDLTASGATREGVLGGLLGATPRLKLSASRLADGAILLRDIDLQGASITAKGSGRRNLLGGLGFDGDVNLTNLSALSAQAKGSFGGNIRARTQRSGAPWSLAFNGSGRNLSTGMEELDRLLGQRPRLAVNGSLNKGVISITQGRLNGDAGQADVIGQIQGDKLRLQMNWNANGPFGVGPVAIDGKMTGDGTLVGTINRPEINLNADFDRVNLGQVALDKTNLQLSFNKRNADSDGVVVIRSSSQGQPVNGRANFALGQNRIALSNVDLNGGGIVANGDITLSNAFPSSADLRFTARPGLFVERGTLNGELLLTENQSNPQAKVAIEGRNFRLRGNNLLIERLTLNGTGTLERLPLTADVQIGGENPIRYSGPALYERQNQQHKLSLGNAQTPASGRVGDIRFTLNNGTHIRTSENGLAANIDAGLGQGRLLAELTPVARTRGGGNVWNLTSNMRDVPIGVFSRDHEGTVTGTVTVNQIGSTALNGNGVIDVRGARLAQSNGDALNARINAALTASSLSLDARADNGAGVGNNVLRANANVVLPLDYVPNPLRVAIDGDGPLNGTVEIKGPIKPIWDLIDGVDRRIDGNIDTRITLSGRLNQRNISGPISITNARVDDVATGLKLRDLNGEAYLTADEITIRSLTAKDDSRGTINASGNLRFRQTSPGQNMGEVNLTLQNFRAVATEEVKLVTSGNLKAIYSGRSVRLDGTLRVDDATIEPVLPGNTGIVRMPVTEINRPESNNSQSSSNGGANIPIILNIKIEAPDIKVRGDGIDMQLEARADVAGTISNPRLNGFAEVVRGTYEFAGKRFTFEPGGRVTLDTNPSRIQLNLTARREDPTITAIIRATGSAAEPRITLSSEPELPQDEILARVLFGRSISQLSPIEAAQLASAVASLAGGGGFDILGNLRQMSGLDSLSFSGDAANLMISGGRRLTDDIYLEVVSGGEAGTSVNVDWQVRRNIAVTASARGDGNAVISVRWRKATD